VSKDQTSKVSVSLVRLCARIYVDDIVFDFDGGSDWTYSRGAILLSNVVGSANMLGTIPADAVWYQRYGDDQNSYFYPHICGQNGMIYEDGRADEEFESGETLEVKDYLYCYANPTSEDVQTALADTSSASWAPRYTRLVVRFQIDRGSDYSTERNIDTFFPISIPGIRAGHTYSVKLTINSLGSREPDTWSPYVPTDNDDYEVSISEWQDYDDAIVFHL